MRNTTATDISFDVFGVPNIRFRVADFQAGNVPPTIIQDADGTWRYVGIDHINFYGTAANDRMQGDRGDDAIWGRAGADRLEGGQGNDSLVGGDGDDIITDLFGIDVILGGTGNDSIFIGGGAGDLVLAGSGKDYVNAGTDAKETFGGLGDDFVLGSSGDDGIQGNRGDDWIEGRAGADGLNGDNPNPFDNDPAGGHDVLHGNDGNTGYIADGGDDIMFATVGADTFDGDLGFDWVIYKGHPTAVDADMNNGEFVPPVPGVVLDQWNLTEGVSGAAGDDILRGMEQPQDADPTFGAVGTGQRLTQEQLDRIPGLRALLSTGAVPQATPTYALPFLFGQPVDPGDFNNNILLGGPGSDTVEPRAGRNFADGDAWLNTRIEWRPAGGPVESADSLTAFDARLRSGAINPADLHIVREVLQLTNIAADIDVLVVPGLAADNPIVNVEPGVWELTYNDGLTGTTIFRNFEEVQYDDLDVCLGPTTTIACDGGAATGAVTIAADTAPAVQQGSVISTTDTVDDPDGLGAFLYSLQSFDGAAWTTLQSNDTGQFTLDQTNVGSNVRVLVSFVDGGGNPESVASNELGPVANVDDEPVAPVISATQPVVTGVAELVTPPTDADGITGAITYQWQASPDGTTWNDIAGGVPLGLTDAHVGNSLRLQASFTDDGGSPEVVVSNVIGPIGPLGP
jgi:Ca2+-binding RTX toxin-like protein